MSALQNIPFLDTNILVYAFENSAPRKQAIARRLLDSARPWHVSWQVVQEFVTVALHKFATPVDAGYLDSLLELLLVPHCTVFPTPELWREALHIQRDTGYRFYDSLIVAAAIEAGANVLLSEDLQHGRKFGRMEIRNPFLN